VWADKPGTEEGTAILVPNMGHGVTASSWSSYKASFKPFSCWGCAVHPCNLEGPQPWWEQREVLSSWWVQGLWGPAPAVDAEGNLEALSPGVTVPSMGWRMQSLLESPEISGPPQVPGRESPTVPISYNALSVACRQGGNKTRGSGGPRAMPALPELCPPCQHCIATCSWACCWGSSTCLLHLLHITLWAAASSRSQGEQKPFSMAKYYNLNPRNPVRTWPCTTACQLSKQETAKATLVHWRTRVQYITAGFPAAPLKENAFLPASTRLPLYHSDLV